MLIITYTIFECHQSKCTLQKQGCNIEGIIILCSKPVRMSVLSNPLISGSLVPLRENRARAFCVTKSIYHLLFISTLMALTSYINMYKPTPARITENLVRLPPRLVRSRTDQYGQHTFFGEALCSDKCIHTQSELYKDCADGVDIHI